MNYGHLSRVFPYAIMMDPAEVRPIVNKLMEQTFQLPALEGRSPEELQGTSFAVTVRPPFPVRSAADRQQWCLWLSAASRDLFYTLDLATYSRVVPSDGVDNF